MTAELERGATVADVGCGHGFSTVTMVKAFPASRGVGYGFHTGSVEQRSRYAAEHDVTAPAQFEVAEAGAFPGEDCGLVICFDCLHGMGDALGAALGTEACFAKRSSVIKEGGFRQVHKASKTPFRMEPEARP